MIVYDKNTFGSNREIDSNGYLRVDSCNITKTQVAPYLGREIPGWKEMGLEAEKIYYVLRPEDELKKAVPTFNNLPLTREHIEVDVENVPKEKIVGSLGDHTEYADGYLKNNLIIYDKKDIDLVMSGKKKELSCGYRYTPVRESGEFNGQHYDFKMTDIIGNHVALVKEGRAGHDVMVSDTIDKIKEKFMHLFGKKELVQDEFIESEHPRAKNGRFTDKAGSSSEREPDYKGRMENYISGLEYQLENAESGEERERLAGELENAKKNYEGKYGPKSDVFKSDLTRHVVRKGDHLYGAQLSAAKEDLKDAIAHFEKNVENADEKFKWIEQARLDKARADLERLESFAKEQNGGYEERKQSFEDFFKDFEEKEDNNLHSENAVALAKRYGTEEEVKEAEEILELHMERMNLTDDLYKRRRKLEEKFIPMMNIEDHLAKKINGWYNNARQDYKGIDGKFLGISAEGDDLKIKWEENGKEKTSIISWFKDYTPEQLYDIWMEFGDEGQIAVHDEANPEVVEDKKDIPDEQEKPEKAGDKQALDEKGEKMEEKKESLAEDKCAAKDEEKKDLKGEAKKDFAEGVEYGEKKEKEEPKKLDSEHESEGTKKADEKEEEKKEAEDAKDGDKKEAKDGCAKDEKPAEMVMDVDAIKKQVREEVMADFKAREEARKSVRSVVGDVNVMSFDSAEEIYKFACEKAGMNLNEIASYKDAFKGYASRKGNMAMDASSVGSNVECFKDIRIM